MGDLGEEAYNVYCDVINWRGPITGDELPPFSELPRRIQDAWRAAAQHVARIMTE